MKEQSSPLSYLFTHPRELDDHMKQRYNLLIVDDEKDILRTLALTFEDDYEVFTARSGLEALGIL